MSRQCRLVFPLLPAALAGLMLLSGCGNRERPLTPADLDTIGERYVRLALALSPHDPDYVDSYYGPPAWRAEAMHDTVPLAVLEHAADSLVTRLSAPLARGADEMTRLRQRYLSAQLASMGARIRMAAGQRMSFDEESQALYDAVAPARSDSSFVPVLAGLDSLLPGAGSLADRWEQVRREFVIPPARLDTVFRVALAEARRRTGEHFELPVEESFSIEFVTGKPWGGYNWYEGGYHSRIEVNTDLPIFIDRALDLACHEGYPGHHVYSVLLEQKLVRERGWREFTLLPLYCPQALIAEGTAVAALDVAFPGGERERFEKTVLCPLAGIDTTRFDRYAAIRAAMEALSMAGVEGARRWLDGVVGRDEARRWLMQVAVRDERRAEKDLSFAERYRSYVVNYRLGRTLVIEWLARNGGDAAHPVKRWELYRTLLAAPRLPSDLREP